MRRQSYSAAFKQESVDELLVGDKRGTQIARERAIDYTTLRRWREEFDQRGTNAWTKETLSAPTGDAKVAELERVIGQLTVENMILKKALTLARSTSKLGTLSSTN